LSLISSNISIFQLLVIFLLFAEALGFLGGNPAFDALV